MQIIYISSIDWDFSWHRQQEMMSKLADRGVQILFVQPNKKDVTLHSKLRKAEDNIWILTCRGIPYERCLRSVNALNAKLSRADILQAMEAINFDYPVVWLDRVHGFDFEYFCQFKTIYDLVDEILAFGRVRNSKMLISLENNVLKKADLLVSSSQTLLQRKIQQSGRKGESIFIPNGVDAARFQQIPLKEKENIIGFVGQISDRSIDIALIREIAQNHPEWKFVFTGPGTQECKARICKGLPNIIMNEPVTGDDVPNVIAGYDVCIIPYLHAEQSMDYVFPRKACEYLAAGKPVVSTNLNEIKYLSPMVTIAEDPQTFAEAIEKAFADDRHMEKREFAKQYDWNVLMPQLLQKIEKIL